MNRSVRSSRVTGPKMRVPIGSSLALSSTAITIPATASVAGSGLALRTIRRDLHEHPELGNREFNTSKMIAAHLRSLGIEVKEGVTDINKLNTLLRDNGAIEVNEKEVAK